MSKGPAKPKESPVTVIRCIAFFADALTKRDSSPGDIVPWTRERAERYPQFVEIV